MKILLIFPPSTIYGSDPTIPAVVPPLGLAYIAGYLEKHGYANVDILDSRSLAKERVTRQENRAIYGLTDNEIKMHIEKASPNIVGISCMYTAYSGDAHRVARIVKEINKDIFVIMGGAHSSTFSDLILKDKNVDVVVHLEGEETFLELVRSIENEKDYTKVKGISFRTNGAIIKNPPRPFIDNLDTIPHPARHLLDMSLYLNKTPNPYAMRAPSTTMVTSRGCPQACVYCTIQSVWGVKKWRGRSSINVVDEMEFLQKKHGIQELYWMDDSAGTDRARLMEICDEIIKRRLDIKWTTPNGIAHWYLNERALEKMKRAGCYRITFGVESGNVETRKFLGKPFPLDQAKRMIRYANKIGMWTVCTFILGFPFETEESILDTVNFACNSGTDMAVFYLLCPHPGTKVYDIFKTEGLLDLDHILDLSANVSSQDFEDVGLKLAGSGVKTRSFTPNELKEYLASAYRSFFKVRLKNSLNPIRTIQKIKNLEDLQYAYKIGKIGIKSAFDSIIKKTFFSQKMSEYRKNNLDVR